MLSEAIKTFKEICEKAVIKSEVIEVPNLGPRLIGQHGVSLLATRELYPTLRINTLAGLVAFIQAPSGGDEALANEHWLVKVEPTAVRLVSRVARRNDFDNDYERQVFVECAPATLAGQQAIKEFHGGQEAAILHLHRCFVPTTERDELLGILAAVRTESMVINEDDGVSQQMTVKAPKVGLAKATTKNPITLRPRSLFPEVAMPDVDFVFRAKAGDGDPRFSLFPADGEAWTVTYAKEIVKYLGEALGDELASKVLA